MLCGSIHRAAVQMDGHGGEFFLDSVPCVVWKERAACRCRWMQLAQAIKDNIDKEHVALCMYATPPFPSLASSFPICVPDSVIGLRGGEGSENWQG
jgi:hypothetical protein